MEKLLYTLIFLPIVLGVFIYLVNSVKLYRWIYLAEAVVMVITLQLLGAVKKGIVLYEVIGGWEPFIGIGLKFDALSATFIILATFLFTVILIFIYQSKDHDFKFLFFVLLLQGTFNGFVLSDDIFNIFVMLELITIISTILIIYKKDAHSLKAGIYYLLFNTVGMMIYLIGVIILYLRFGTLNLSLMAELVTATGMDDTVRIGVILMVSAFGVKSAVFPVYDWLPKAHSAAITSISALLSGLLVKTGIIGLMKLTSVFKIFDFSGLFYLLGIFTALMGVVFAFSQKDIKQILSFHTVSQIGLIMIAFSINIDMALLYLVSHSLIKSLLFLGSGIVINQYKERRVDKIRGLWENDSLLSVFLIIGTFALAGIPFTSGYIAKSAMGMNLPLWQLLPLVLVNSLTAGSMFKILQILGSHQPVKVDVKTSKYVAMGFLSLAIFFLGTLFPDYQSMTRDLWYYFKPMNLVKTSFEVLLGITWFFAFGIHEKALMKKMRHFSLSFDNGIVLLVFFVLSLVVFI